MEGRRKRRWRVVEEKSMEREGREERKRGWRVVEEKSMERGGREERKRGWRMEEGGWQRKKGLPPALQRQHPSVSVAD